MKKESRKKTDTMKMKSGNSVVPFLFLLSLIFHVDNGVSASRRRKTVEDVELTEFMTRLWNGDDAKARLDGGIPGLADGGGDIKVDLGGRTTIKSKTDAASGKLFRYVNEGKLFAHPSTAALLRLHDDYKARASTPEDQERNPEELREINAFLNLVVNSPTMQRTNQFLRQKGILANQSMTSVLRHIWFDLYSRHRGVLGSSGFEHVFLGEIDGGKVKGVHNWIWVYLMEKKGVVDYQGYLSTPKRNPTLISNRFNWRFENHDYRKDQTSFILGSTPEFDMALFTVCFLKHPNAVSKFRINGTTYMVQTWKNQDGTLGSAYFLG